MIGKEIKIYVLLLNNFSKQLMIILDKAKERYIKVTHITFSYYVHQQMIEEMNECIILGGDIQKLYEPILSSTVTVSINPLFVFNIIELIGEKQSGFQIRV